MHCTKPKNSGNNETASWTDRNLSPGTGTKGGTFSENLKLLDSLMLQWYILNVFSVPRHFSGMHASVFHSTFHRQQAQKIKQVQVLVSNEISALPLYE